MANGDRPRGFWPYGTIKNPGKAVAGAAVRAGEFVTLQADGKCDPAAAGATIFALSLENAEDGGSFMCSYPTQGQEYVGQADGSDVDAQTDVGNCCDILATASDSTYDQARQEIDSSTIGAVAAQLTILGIEERPDNDFGAQAEVRVKVNEQQAHRPDFAGI